MGIATRGGTQNSSEGTVNNFWKILTIIFLGAIFVAVMTQSAGTIFTGINGLAGTLEAGNIKAGS